MITAIADAKLDSIPVVAITGQVSSSLIGSDAFQEVDIFLTFKTYKKGCSARTCFYSDRGIVPRSDTVTDRNS